MRNTFNPNLAFANSRLRLYKLKLTRNGPISSIRVRLFANPQFRSSKFKFVLTPISEFGSKNFYTNFSYKYFLSKWKKFEHKKIINNFLRPSQENFPVLAHSPRSYISDYRIPVKHRSFIYRGKEYKLFVTRSRFIRKAYFKQRFTNPFFIPSSSYVNSFLRRRQKKVFVRSKKRLLKFGLEVSKGNIKYLPFFFRRKFRLRSLFPSVFRFKRRYGRINRKYKKLIKRWFRRPRSFTKYRAEKSVFFSPRFFSRTPAFRFFIRLNSFPNFKKIRYFSKIRFEKALSHTNLRLFCSVLRNVPSERSSSVNRKMRRRKNRFKVFKKFFRLEIKKVWAFSSVSRNWTWKFRNCFKFLKTDKTEPLFKFIFNKYFGNHFTSNPNLGKSKILREGSIVDISKLALNDKFLYFYKLLSKRRRVSIAFKKLLKPRNRRFEKKIYYSQVYRRRMLVKYFRFSFYFYLFSKAWALRRNTKSYSTFIKELFFMMSKMAVKGNFVYIIPFLINKNNFFGTISLINSDFYSREPFTTFAFSSFKNSKATTYRLKHKI